MLVYAPIAIQADILINLMMSMTDEEFNEWVAPTCEVCC